MAGAAAPPPAGGGGAVQRVSAQELAALIADVAAWLKGGADATSADSGGVTAVTTATQADALAAQFAAKLRAIMPRLLDALLDPERGAPGGRAGRGRAAGANARRARTRRG